MITNKSKIYMYCDVIDTNLYEEIQKLINSKILNFVPNNKEKSHVTVGNIGNPSELHKQILQTGVVIPFIVFLEILSINIIPVLNCIPTMFNAKIDGLEVLGRNKTTIALRISDGHLRCAQVMLYEAMLSVLKKCGVVEAEDFIFDSAVLFHLTPSKLNTHISLGDCNSKINSLAEVEKLLSINSKIQLDSLKIENFL